MQKQGFFITFEGPEGAGKSSQVARLASYLESKGISCLITREPGGTPLAEKLRQVVKSHNGAEKVYPETELLLMEAARAQHAREVILPALEAGEWVICDRFTDSTTAYQGGARKLSWDVIATLNDFASASIKPDLTFLMDLPPEEGFRRISTRESEGFDRFENEQLDFHRQVREAFLKIASSEPERVKLIDATQDIDTISTIIRDLVNDTLF